MERLTRCFRHWEKRDLSHWDYVETNCVVRSDSNKLCKLCLARWSMAVWPIMRFKHLHWIRCGTDVRINIDCGGEYDVPCSKMTRGRLTIPIYITNRQHILMSQLAVVSFRIRVVVYRLQIISVLDICRSVHSNETKLQNCFGRSILSVQHQLSLWVSISCLNHKSVLAYNTWWEEICAVDVCCKISLAHATHVFWFSSLKAANLIYGLDA